jgi:flagellar motor switch protein FliN/FliY
MASLSPLDPRPDPSNGAKPAARSASDEAAFLADSALLGDVSVTLQARLGSVDMPLAELIALRPGSAIALPTALSEPIGLFLNDALIARGEIVAVDDRFGLRIVEIAAR